MKSAGNIIFTLPAGFTLSGVTNWTVGMARHLTARGQPVRLLCHTDVLPAVEVSLPDGVHLVEVQNRASPYELYTETDVNDYVTDYHRLLPGTVILNGGSGSFAACARLTVSAPEALRTIAVAHADEPVYYDWLTYYEPIIHQFIAVSRMIAQKLIRFIPHRHSDIVVRPCAVEVNSTLNRAYSIPAEPLQLMYAGRIIETQKRVSDLIRLVELLAAAGVNFHLRLVGEGPDVPVIKDRLRFIDPATARRVSLVGLVPPDQMAGLWQAADVCLLVSHFEGTSVTMLEAMAAGCVPVVTDVNGARDVIQPGQNGFVVPVGQMEAMAEILTMLAQDRTRLTIVGTQAHATIASRYDYDSYTTWLLELIDQVWRAELRVWPLDRALHRRPPLKESLNLLSGEQLSQLVSTRKLVKALGFQTARHPAFKWLYRFRGIGKKLMGG